MNSETGPSSKARPRWGTEQRDLKAIAIWETLRAMCEGSALQGTWLDVGCGSGGIVRALAPKVSQFLATDPEPWPEWGDIERENPNTRFVVGRFDHEVSPFSEETVDLAICNQVYEHVEDPGRLIGNLAAVLRPGGYVYFAGPNLFWPIEPHVHWPFVHWLPRSLAIRLMKGLGSKRTPDLDAHSSHRWQLERWFRAAGLEYRNGIRSRALAEAGSSSASSLARIGGRIVPDVVWNVLLAVMPGFVYILRKPVGTR